MAVLKKSPLEVFINSYVRQFARRKVALVYIQKAITLISEKLNPSCCEGTGPVDIHTFRDNTLTRAVKMYINGMPNTAANRASLNRAKTVLEIFVNKCVYCA